jgi:transposase-like protein
MANDRGRAFWEGLVREVAAGASQVAVARRHGVSSTWLGKWCRELRAEAVSTTALLPVRVTDGQARRVELAIGNVHLAFEEGTDPEYVARLARELAS